MPTFGSLFSGIGGMDLGLERAGWTCKWQVEKNEYCQRILAKHWPNVRRWDDVTTFPPADATIERTRKVPEGRGEKGEREANVELCSRSDELRVDLIAGGFPCQPVSVAGRRQAERDPRWLWPHFARIVRLLRPRYVLVENVPGLLVAGHGGLSILADLAEMGFDAEWATLPASAFGAPHLRERVFIVAYAGSESAERGRRATGGQGRQPAGTLEPTAVRQADRTPSAEGLAASSFSIANAGSQQSDERHDAPVQRRRTRKAKQAGMGSSAVADRDRDRAQARIFRAGGEIAALPLPCWGTDQPGVARTLNGVSHRVDRIAGLGNAVVPQVAEWIGRQLLEVINPK